MKGVKKPQPKGKIGKLVLITWVLVIIVILAVTALALTLTQRGSDKAINSFQTCKDAGGRIAESYPEQCFINGKNFVNDLQVGDTYDSYVGLTEQEAMDRAKRENKPHRVVERDGQSLPVTMDFVEGRLNFHVRDNRVYKVEVES